jgi:DNA-binding NtrC family response regulator
MHRAVLLSNGDTIETTAILLAGGYTSGPAPTEAAPAHRGPAPAPMRAGSGGVATVDAPNAPASAAGLIGRTVADVERDLIIGTLSHTLGNRTHAANILGISIRTLRNKLKEYSESGIRVPMPGEGERPAL